MPPPRPLRVAIDQRLVAYRGGGIARYAVELSAALREVAGIEPLDVRSVRDRGAGAGAVRLRTPPHHRLEEWAVGAEMLLKGREAGLFHATDFIAPRLVRTPVVATVHDLAFARWPENLAPDAFAYYRRIRRSRGWTRCWITPSHWTARELAAYLDIDPDIISVVPHGVPSYLGHATPLSREERGDYLLAVGTVEPRKRYALLLDALLKLAGGPRLKIVGGRGWQSAEVERRLASTAGVEWLSHADDRQLAELYRGTVAVVVPSLAEGFGFAALEAMAVGTPVVSSAHGALPEVTGESALTPETDDPEGWSRAISRIIEDRALWRRLSVDGYERAREFTWQRAAEMTAEVYRRAGR